MDLHRTGGRRRPGPRVRRDQSGVGPRGDRRACGRACGSAYPWSGCCSSPRRGSWSGGRCAGSTGSVPRSTPSPRKDLSRRVGTSGGSWVGADEVGRLARHHEPDARSPGGGPGAAAQVRGRHISTDLRSPLTAQRQRFGWPIALPATKPTMGPGSLHRDLLAHVDEIDASLVGDLLFVVTDDERPRTDQGLDLEDVVLEEAARVLRLGGPAVDTSEVSAAPVVGDPGEFRRLVRNLVENGVTHASSGASSSGHPPTAGWSAWTSSTTAPAYQPARKKPCSSGFTGATRPAADGAPGWASPSPARSPSGTAAAWPHCPSETGAHFRLVVPSP